jgi:hypothetical protein
VADAVNVIGVPTTDGAGRFELMLDNVSTLDGGGVVGGGVDGGGVDGGVDDDGNIENGMLPFELALSYASALLPALRIHTATRAFAMAPPGVHVHRSLDVHCCITTQLPPSKIHHLY